jgi:hypothetical protein
MYKGDSNMTETDLCVNKPHKSRSYLSHLFLMYSRCFSYVVRGTSRVSVGTVAF